MSQLERMLLEIELDELKKLLDFYVWRLEIEGESSEILDSIDTLLEKTHEIKERLNEDES